MARSITNNLLAVVLPCGCHLANSTFSVTNTAPFQFFQRLEFRQAIRSGFSFPARASGVVVTTFSLAARPYATPSKPPKAQLLEETTQPVHL